MRIFYNKEKRKLNSIIEEFNSFFKIIIEIIDDSSMNNNSFALIEVYAYTFFNFDIRIFNLKRSFRDKNIETIDNLCKENLRLLIDIEEDITEKIVRNRLSYYTNILKKEGLHSVTLEYNNLFANSMVSSKEDFTICDINKKHPPLELDIFSKVKIDLILTDIAPIIFKFENKIFNMI